MKNIIVLIFIFAVYANTVTFGFNAGMGNFGKRQIDKVRRYIEYFMFLVTFIAM